MTPGYLTILLSILVGVGSGTHLAGAIRAGLSAEGRQTVAVLNAEERADLLSLYSRIDFGPVWVDSTGRPTQGARDAVSLIQRAAADGLDPSDYHAAELGELAGRLGAQRRGDSAEAIRFDLALSGDMLRYFRQLHQGRIDARLLGLDIPGPAHRHDYAAWLRSTVDGNRLASVADDLAPPLAQYRNLRVMLAKYRAIADAPGRAPLPAFPAVLRPGDAWAGSPALQELLVALGDVPPDAPAPVSGVYEGAVVAGVERFQDRHGLAPDGVLGKTTQATLPGDSVGNDPLVGGFRSPSGTTVRQRR